MNNGPYFNQRCRCGAASTKRFSAGEFCCLRCHESARAGIIQPKKCPDFNTTTYAIHLPDQSEWQEIDPQSDDQSFRHAVQQMRDSLRQ